MFCALLKFTVKPDHDDQFRQHWLAVTQWYYHNAGSLGSRLHRANTGEYIGYAQWISREQWASQTYLQGGPRGSSQGSQSAVDNFDNLLAPLSKL